MGYPYLQRSIRLRNTFVKSHFDVFEHVRVVHELLGLMLHFTAPKFYILNPLGDPLINVVLISTRELVFSLNQSQCVFPKCLRKSAVIV